MMSGTDSLWLEFADLPVLRTTVFISDDNIGLNQRIIKDGKPYRLPVVCVSKTEENADPLRISYLASRLKGAAHILAEEAVESCPGHISGCFCRGWIRYICIDEDF